LAGDDPLLTEWLAIREIASAVLVYHKVNPMPSGTLSEEKCVLSAQAIWWATWQIHSYAIPEAERQGMTPPPVLREIGMRSEEIEARYFHSLDSREPKNAMKYTKSAINYSMSEGMRWMVYGKDVIMPKTGKPMREFFEDEQEARNVAIVVSSSYKGRLGVYACNEGTLESFELIAEYEDGDRLVAVSPRPDPSCAAPPGCAAVGGCMAPIVGILLTAVLLCGLLLLLKWIVGAL